MPQKSKEIAPWEEAETQEVAPWGEPTPVNPTPTGTITAEPHPTESKIGSFVNDVKYGPSPTDTGLTARVMRGLGFHGLETGHGKGVAGMMPGAGAVEGVPELIHAASQIPQMNTGPGFKRAANEGLEGTFHTIAGGAPIATPSILPMAVPAATMAGTTGAAASGTARLLGAEPDTQELVGNLATLATPGIKEAARPIGRFLEKNAPAVGKAAGYGTAVATAAKGLMNGKGINPLDLLFASPLITKPATKASSMAGKLAQSVGELNLKSGTPSEPMTPVETQKALPRGPLITPEPASPESPLSPPPPVAPTTRAQRLGLLLPEPTKLKEPIITPPPEGSINPEPSLVNAQPLVTHGKGGKFTKQFTANPTTGKTLMNPGPAWRGPGSEVPTLINNINSLKEKINGVKPVESGTPPPETTKTIDENLNELKQKTQKLSDLAQAKVPKPLIVNGEAQPLTKGSESPIVNNMESKQDFPEGPIERVYPGDYQLINPTEVVHGSNSPNPEDFRGVFFNYKEEPTATNYGPLHSVTLPKGALIRQEPFLQENIFKGSVPSGLVKTAADTLEEKGIQEANREDLQRGEENAEDLSRKLMYAGHKVYNNPRTGTVGYNPGDVESLFPWAETPWNMAPEEPKPLIQKPKKSKE